MDGMTLWLSPQFDIWVKEIVLGRKFAGNFKLGDVSPFAKNWRKSSRRPVSLLTVVSKLFKRLMLKQMKDSIEMAFSLWERKRL